MLKSFIRRMRRDQRGATLVEYGIALIVAVTVGTPALLSLAGEINTQIGEAETAMVGGDAADAADTTN